jgi:hypothetical protein
MELETMVTETLQDLRRQEFDQLRSLVDTQKSIGNLQSDASIVDWRESDVALLFRMLERK